MSRKEERTTGEEVPDVSRPSESRRVSLSAQAGLANLESGAAVALPAECASKAVVPLLLGGHLRVMQDGFHV
jgi:hypothetical protein